MWRLLVLSLAACGTVHTASSSPQVEQARRERLRAEQCAVLTGLRHATCMRLGPPRAPDHGWETATWWLYESRSWETVRNNIKVIGPQVVCASFVAFHPDRVVESDEQCHRVKHYDP
jgi:hypothetical protein